MSAEIEWHAKRATSKDRRRRIVLLELAVLVCCCSLVLSGPAKVGYTPRVGSQRDLDSEMKHGATASPGAPDVQLSISHFGLSGATGHTVFRLQSGDTLKNCNIFYTWHRLSPMLVQRSANEQDSTPQPYLRDRRTRRRIQYSSRDERHMITLMMKRSMIQNRSVTVRFPKPSLR